VALTAIARPCGCVGRSRCCRRPLDARRAGRWGSPVAAGLRLPLGSLFALAFIHGRDGGFSGSRTSRAI